MSKYIKVPAPVTLADPATGASIEGAPSITLGDFIRNSLMADERWRTDLTWLRAEAEIRDLFKKGSEVTGYVTVRNDDYEKLVSVAKNPKGGYQGYNPVIFVQLLPLIEAIVGASDEEPKTASA